MLIGALAIGSMNGQPARADATVPTKDITGARDNLVLKRYEGSFIVSYQRSAFNDFKIPLSKLELVPDKRDVMNNRLFAPKEQKELEGPLTRLAYVMPADRSPLEVLRNYQDEITNAGGSVLYSCKTEECGGDAKRSSYGGGSDSSLMMYFFHDSELKDPAFSNGACALTSSISDQRFFAGKMPGPDGDIYVTVQTYLINNDMYCKAISGRTAALVHILEPRAREKKMTTVSAAEMAKSIGATGRVALYDIFFDTAKADLKPQSEPALKEIASLLQGDQKLAVLIVGHTDNQGGFDYNVDLSRKRADAVVKALSATYKIDAKRLRAAGAGMIAPAASNDDETGRAKNRRVEVVKLN
ncbi:MAG: OmpA family protein [Beijerinckiaceae bacterium]|nr:OmpA family protein [Beijerinckiaceae bacterium]